MTASCSSIIPPTWHWASNASYSPARRVGDLIVTSGIASLDEWGEVVGGEDFQAQARRAVGNLAELLEFAGSSLDGIVRQTVFLRRTGDVEIFQGLRRTLYREPFPASVLVVVTAHALPSMLIEITCEAVVHDRATPVS